MYRSPKTNQRLERHLAIFLDGTDSASLTIGSGLAALTDNGTGDYTLTFNKPFARAPIVLVTPLTKVYANVTASSTTACTIKTFNDGGSAVDADMNVLVIGWDTADEYSEL